MIKKKFKNNKQKEQKSYFQYNKIKNNTFETNKKKKYKIK